jgi:hypothetical protein
LAKIAENCDNKKTKPGTDVIILKIFSPKNFAKILAFFVQTTAFLQKNDNDNGF